jgi:hypothetical protein
VRSLPAIAVVLAVVATALVGVRQHGECRRLERKVWEAMRRRDALTKQVRELETAIQEVLSPRRLLEEHDRRTAERAR